METKEGQVPPSSLPPLKDDVLRDFIQQVGGYEILEKLEIKPTAQKEEPVTESDKDRELMEKLLKLSEKGPSPYGIINKAIREFTQPAWVSLARTRPEFVRKVNEMLKTTPVLGLDADYYSEGMGGMLRLYDMQTDYSLLNGLSSLTEEDWSKVEGIIEEGLPSERQTMLEQILQTPEVPETDVNANEAIRILSVNNDYEQRRTGAAIMYRVLSEMWPKLQPPINNGAPAQQEDS